MYIYTKDLLKLEHTFQRGQSISVDPRLTGIHAPLQLASWQKRLYPHPDKEFSSYILRGIEKGFYIGVDAAFPLISAKKNMQSASQHLDVIDKYIQAKLKKNRIKGPFHSHLAPSVHINRFGLFLKKHQAGKWRLITDLSFPEGASINDAIDSTLCSRKYITVDKVA